MLFYSVQPYSYKMDSDADVSLATNWTCRNRKLRYAVRHESWRPKLRIALIALLMAAVSLSYLVYFLR